MKAKRETFADPAGLAIVYADAAPPSGEAPYVLAVPGARAPIYRLTLPARVPAAARLRIAAQQIAEQLGTAVGSLRIVPVLTGGATAKTWDRVLVVDPAQLVEWTAQVGPSCRAILPDYLLVPVAQETVALIRHGDTVLARIGEVDGFSAPVPLASALLGLALNDAKPRHATLGPGVPDACRAVLEAAGVPIETQDSGALTVTPLALKQDLRTNLSGATPSSPTVTRLWGAVAASALLTAGLWVASLWIEVRGIERQTRALQVETTEILRQNLLPTGPIVDVRVQVERRFDERGPAPDGAAGPAVTRLIGRVSDVMAEKGHRVDALSVTEDALTLDLHAPDFATVDVLQSAFTAEGLNVRSEQVRSVAGGGVEARLRIDRHNGDTP